MKARIIFLLLSAAVLAGAFALTDALNSRTDEPGVDRGDGVTVAVATDLHYLAPELTDGGEFFTRLVSDADGKVMLYIDELVRAFAWQVADERPDALIISGDLTFNGETASHEALADILSGIEAAGVPVYVIPGNHDLNSSMAARYSGDGYERVESPTEGEFAQIYTDFGYNEAISRDGSSLSYTAQLAPGVRLLMLDVNTRTNPGWALDGTLEWLDDQLAQAAAAGERVIAVSHQNLYAHSSLFVDGYVIGNAGALAESYAEYGVLCNLSGHIHLQHTAAYNGLPEIVTSSLAVSPNQYGLLTVGEGSCEYAAVSVDVSAWAAEEGVDGAELEDFAAYSAGFFRQTALDQAYAALGDAADAEALADFYAEVNAQYFAGRSDLITWDEELMDGWSGHGFTIPMYLESIRMGEAADHTHMRWQTS